MSRAIIAGRGILPQLLWNEDTSAVFVTIAGVEVEVPAGATNVEGRFEKLGRLFSDLKKADVSEIVMAGAMDRPSLNPAKFDMKMIKLAPGLMKAMREGDDHLLRRIIDIFENEGFSVVGAGDLAPDLVAQKGLQLGPTPSNEMVADADKAFEILDALAPFDLGQVVVVAGGQCLGIETTQGTDALLKYVSECPPQRRPSGGTMVKAAKAGQELRVDMPTIGVDTIRAALNGGLSGICLRPQQVLLLERTKIEALAKESGFSLWCETAK